MKTIFFLVTLLSLGMSACTTTPSRNGDDSEPHYRERFFGKMGM